MASSDRFLARAGEISLLFYQILRNPSKFEWSPIALAAFQKLKKHLSSLPLLVTQPLYLYLAIIPKVISSVLYSFLDNNNMKAITM